MKKYLIVFSIIFLALTSCSTQELAPAVNNEVETTVTILPENISTKTPLPKPDTTPTQSAKNPQEESIQSIRLILELPDLPLEFVEETFSPNANEMVETYKDSAGRKYFVSIETNRVVEFDGRDLLSPDTTIEPTLTLETLREHTERIAQAVFPEFSSLIYEEGLKGDFYFFVWRDNNSPMQYLQLAFLKNGQLFAYYNTLAQE